MDRNMVKKAFDTAHKIVKSHLNEFDDGFPGPASENNWYKKVENVDWTAGFYTGLLWLFYEETKDTLCLQAAQEQLKSFDNRIEKRIQVDHHDMGFLYSPSCVAAYKLIGDGNARKTALKAADNLAFRFREKGEFIQAWGLLDSKDAYRLIIDCLLNLPLLYWASDETGDKRYHTIAKKHLQTAASVLIRTDYSTYHTYYFDKESGKPAYGSTHQGYSDHSAWSRGQAWGLYGLALNYSYLKDKAIVEKWRGVTDYFLTHLPEDLTAYWDFSFIEGDEPRDSSASAIAVCGILEAYRQGMCDQNYKEKADLILANLIKMYAASEEEEGNGLLKHSTYSRKRGNGVDEYCLWGDYFYVEALMRVLHPDWKMYW
ncbi:glycoside hydrolase family 88 protein [Hungatella effluvii]|uniref:glycoside hydrolase family 88 protein n=1 Tax=Hungatella effluvii TaxID=1096246 RepID=UPI0022E03575|nr:glycoside hydrolase family 88 protein [Hungatella effluvii]